MELRESQLVEKDAALHPDPVAEATPEEPQSWFVRMESTMLPAMASKTNKIVTKGEATATSIDVQRSMPSGEALARNKDLPTLLPFDRLKLSGVSTRPQLYNCYLDVCEQCGSTSACLRPFEEMKQWNILTLSATTAPSC